MACITKRRGRWVLDFYDTQGKRHWKTMPKGSTKAKALEALREVEDQVARGIYLPEMKIPTFKKVAKDWLAYKKTNLRASTWQVYEGHTKNHFGDLDPVRINRITIAHIEKFIASRQEQGMNLATLRKILVSLNQIMAYAVRHRYIDSNPVRDVERPRGQGKQREAKIRVLNPQQIANLLDAEPDQKYRTLFMLAIMTGARQGELLGLKWADVDWERGQIHIRRSYNKGAWYDVKTHASDRRVDLGPAMIKRLRRWRLACSPNDLDLIFPNEAGQPMNYSNMVNRYFRPALKRAGIGIIRFHDLRHTKASLMIDQGENIKYIQTQLGHSSPSVTLNVYAHLLKGTDRDAASRMEDTIFSTTGSKMVAENEKGATAKTVTP